MDVILSISAWFNFIVERLLLDAIYVPVAILTGFAIFKYKEYKNKQMLRFILTALIFSILICYIQFVLTGTKINTRYLYSSAFYVIILCVPGFFVVILLLKYLIKKISWIKEKHLIVFLLLVIGAGSMCKAFGIPDKKKYIHGTADIIKVASPSILISNLADSRRVAWHSNARLIELYSVTNIENPFAFGSALNSLNLKNKNIFVLVKFKDSEFKKYFSNKKIEFPKELKLLKEFKAKHKRFYSLYKFKTKNNGEK